MKIAFAIDSFKDAANQKMINQEIKKRLVRFDQIIPVFFKMADGGEGTMDALCDEYIEINTVDALFRPIKQKLGVFNDYIVVEMAQSSGLELIEAEKRNPVETSTYGFGLAMLEALKYSKKLILTVGGSATCDCGLGMIEALGATFEANGQRIPNVTPKKLMGVSGLNIDVSKLLENQAIDEILVLSDVQYKLTGVRGSAHVFAPQKGASYDQVLKLDNFLVGVSDYFGFPENASDGAAGGIVYLLRNLLKATVKSGAAFILQEQKFQEHDFKYLITGEGKFDDQTLFGKAVYQACSMFDGVKIGVFGQIVGDWRQLLDSAFCVQKGCYTLEEGLNRAFECIGDTVESIIALIEAAQTK